MPTTVTDYRQIQQVWNPAKPTGRTGTACTRCRRKQVKCDGATPRCRRCAWGDHECIYLKVVKSEPDLNTLQSEATQRPATMSRKHQKLMEQVRDMERQMGRLREEMRSMGRIGSADNDIRSDIRSDISSSDSTILEFDEESDYSSLSDAFYGDTGSPGEQTVPDSAEFREACRRTTNQYEMKINSERAHASQMIVSDSHSRSEPSSSPTQWKLTITANGVRIQTNIQTVYQLNHFLATSAPPLFKVPSQQQKRSMRPLFVLWNNRWSKYTDINVKPKMPMLIQNPVAIPADQDSRLLSYIQAHESEILYFIIGVWQRYEHPEIFGRQEFMAHYRILKANGHKQVPRSFRTLLYSVACTVALAAFTMHEFKCDEPLPSGVTALEMGRFVADYFFPLVKDGIFAYMEDPEPSAYIITAFFHVLLYQFRARKFELVSTYLSLAARVASMFGFELPESRTLVKHAMTIDDIKSSVVWTVLSNYDETISSIGYTSVIPDRVRRLAIASQILTQPNNLSPEELGPMQFQICYSRQLAINREILETFYCENSPVLPSTDDLARFEEMWAEWWNSLPPWMRPTPQYRYSSHNELMTALQMAIFREIGTIDTHLPFVEGGVEKDFDPILILQFPKNQIFFSIGQTVFAPADKRPSSRPNSPVSSINEDFEDEPAAPGSSHMQRAILLCSQSAIRVTKLVLAIHKNGGNRFPLSELGRACEVHIKNLSAKELDIAATARAYLALSYKIISEFIAFKVGDDKIAAYANYLKDVIAENGVNAEDLAMVDEEDYFRAPVNVNIGCE